MKSPSVFLALLVLTAIGGLAALEFTHHFSEGHALTVSSTLMCADPALAAQEAKALLREHLLGHQR